MEEEIKPIFTEEIRQLTTNDPGHPDTFNPIFKQLHDNTKHLRGLTQEQDKQIKNLESQIEGVDNSWNGIQDKPDTFPPSSHTHSEYASKNNINDNFKMGQYINFYDYDDAGSESTMKKTFLRDGIWNTTFTDIILNGFRVKSEIDNIKNGYVKKNNGEITGNLNANIGGRVGRIIDLRPGDANGTGIGFGAGGLTVVGGGESAATYLDQLPDGGNAATEHAVVCADTSVIIRSNVQNGFTNANKYEFKNGDLFIDGVGLKASVSSGKNAIATAITGKGVAASGSDSHATLANKIGQIVTGLTNQTYYNIGKKIIDNIFIASEDASGYKWQFVPKMMLGLTKLFPRYLAGYNSDTVNQSGHPGWTIQANAGDYFYIRVSFSDDPIGFEIKSGAFSTVSYNENEEYDRLLVRCDRAGQFRTWMSRGSYGARVEVYGHDFTALKTF